MVWLRWVAIGLLVALALWFERSDTPNNEPDLASVKPFKTLENYEQARRVFWRELYPGAFTTLYCGERRASREVPNINIEHVFPMGWVTHALDCGTRTQCRASTPFNHIEADLHNLFPTRTDVNKARGSFRFGVVTGEKRTFGQHCDFEVDRSERHVEPRPDVRGDIARAMLYMQSQYGHLGLKIYRDQEALLRQWHKADPPDAQERARNDAIESIQGNRNSWIDASSS